MNYKDKLAYNRKYRKEHPDKTTYWDRQKHLRRAYGLEVKDYDVLYQSQNGKCAICQEPFTKRPHIDHDHVSSRVRGLLCFKCNALLGNAGDRIAVLENAIQYLQR